MRKFFIYLLSVIPLFAFADEITMVDFPSNETRNQNYHNFAEPLRGQRFVKLPVGTVKPEGWVRRYLELQRDGLTGHLTEISAWLQRDGNAWLSKGGDHGWEEVPYWLKGYGNIAYILGDKKMLDETKMWIEAALASQQPDGYFGPINERGGKRELWAQMIMLWCLQSYYEYSGDNRVLDLMTKYFRWQTTVPDDQLLEDYWENSRGGDNLYSIYWLYSHTKEPFLLDLAHKIHRNTADWMQDTSLPNWHNVNIAQCFREPAEYYMLTGNEKHLHATYNVFYLIRRTFGQVPGGMFGADENARMGYIDPRQGVETCGMVEQMVSDEMLLCLTGDPFWAENCEDVAFNSYPAAVTADFRGLRYVTCPNQAVADNKNHWPSIDNRGPFVAMSPFSNRCCQHNHAMGWPYYAEHLVLATPDDGAAVALYAACEATMKVADGKKVTIKETTNYPFEESVTFTVTPEKKNLEFPLYLRIPAWCNNASLMINGKAVNTSLTAGKYVCIRRAWNKGDKVELALPMRFTARTWAVNKNSVSVNYGPLTLSLKIKENYEKVDIKSILQWDSDVKNEIQWDSWSIVAGSPWNYALVVDKDLTLSDLELVRKPMPADNFPFTLDAVPLEVKAKGRLVPSWGYDKTGFTGVLPDECAPRADKADDITLVPMGAARLRISAFPQAK